MSNIIKQLEQEQLKQNVPSFRPGDTLEVKVWVVEGSKRRLQAFEGVVPKLMSQFFLQSGKTAHQLLIASVYIHVEMEVAAIDDCVRGISAGKDISVNTHRTVILLHHIIYLTLCLLVPVMQTSLWARW